MTRLLNSAEFWIASLLIGGAFLAGLMAGQIFGG